ncbi:MAG: DUF72 domain-containing protein [Candidatus Goldbacteria bacterium]|nr:DUF72 domain-containing protein [Candidatus Goldiibacteriota bacterium]HPD18657.1 DUF72 domain-containing protein [Candidatus Goldiibacteriota bacterium]
MTKIKIGTSGFSFPDWRDNIYPAGLPQKDELRYYCHELNFDCLEVNATYYTIISEKSAIAMEKKTDDNFEFVVKGYKGFTHDPFDNRIEKKPNSEKIMDDIIKFKSALNPFIKKNKLGCVLLQFPVFFYPSQQSEDYILKCKKMLDDVKIVVEFRNNEWAKQRTFEFLRHNNIGYCAVDEPRLPRLMPFINEVTSDIAYIRFHGRNKNWFNSPVSERYDYLYSDEELEKFIPEIKKMTLSGAKTYVFFNNCHAGSAVKNAMKMRNFLIKENLYDGNANY